MTDRIEDGGPAFPHDKYQRLEDGQWGTFAHGGMTLRDWFAGRAPVTFEIAAQVAGYKTAVTPEDRPNVWRTMTLLRFEYADAMLAARKGGAE